MGGSRSIQAPKPQAQEYTPVFQKDGNYYKRDAPKSKGESAGGRAQHGGNPMKASANKGKASVPSYTQLGSGGMAQTADMPKQANRFLLGNYQPQGGGSQKTYKGFTDKRGLEGRGGLPIRQPAGRRPNGYMGEQMKPSSADRQIAPYRGGMSSMAGKGMF